MTVDDFRNSLLTRFDEFKNYLATDAGDWVVKGFIDVYKNTIDERRIYTLNDLQDIVSVVKDFRFLLQEKWRIASDRPGSGNTKNIGSIKNIQDLIEGNGIFASYGQEVFDDYWMNYLTEDMARAIDSHVPYRNLAEYRKWRGRVLPKER